MTAPRDADGCHGSFLLPLLWKTQSKLSTLQFVGLLQCRTQAIGYAFMSKPFPQTSTYFTAFPAWFTAILATPGCPKCSLHILRLNLGMSSSKQGGSSQAGKEGQGKARQNKRDHHFQLARVTGYDGNRQHVNISG